jgi:uncharacterized membrane protein YeiH
MLETLITLLDVLGVAVFAVTGALVASRKQMDVVGFALLATVTGIGGGTLRDLLLGIPVFWVQQPMYVGVCFTVAILVFFTAHIRNRATASCCGWMRWACRFSALWDHRSLFQQIRACSLPSSWG